MPLIQEIEAKLSEAQKRYRTYAAKLQTRVAGSLRDGTPPPVILRALDRLITQAPDHPIGYYDHITRVETPNFMEQLAIQEIRRLSGEPVARPRRENFSPLGASGLLAGLERWAAAQTEVNAAFRLAGDREERQMALAECRKTFDLDQLRLLAREWSRPLADI